MRADLRPMCRTRFGVFALSALSLTLLFSCSRTVERPTKTEMPIDTPSTPSSIRIEVGDQSVRLSWAPAEGAVKYRLYRADTTALSFRTYDSTTQLTFTDQGVANTVAYFYRIAAVGVDGVEGARSPAVSARPGIFAVAINDDKTYTKSLGVTLSLSAPFVSGSVRISNSVNLEDRPWQNFSGAKSWELEPGDGIKTVYVQFRDAAGAVSLDAATDEIILDTRAAIDSVVENSLGRALGAGDTVLFTVATGESNGTAFVDVGGISLECVDDGTRGDGISGDGRYHRSWVVPASADFEASAVIGRFTDRAGNPAEQRSAPTLLTVRRTPDPVTAFAFTEADTRIAVSWTQSSAEDFAFYRVFRAKTSTVTAESTMVFSTPAKTSTSYADTGLDYSTAYHYAVWVYDRTGLSAPSSTVSAQTRVNTAPEAVIVSQPVDVDSTRLRLSWSQSFAADFASYRVYRAQSTERGSAVLVAVISNRTETQYTDNNLDVKNKAYYYWVAVHDRGGLFTEAGPVGWVP